MKTIVATAFITMRDIVNAPIFVRLGRRARGPNNPPPGVINRVRISNIVASNVDSRHGMLISGIPDRQIEDVRLPRDTVPVFSLRSVTDFFHRNSPGVPDRRLANVDKDAF